MIYSRCRSIILPRKWPFVSHVYVGIASGRDGDRRRFIIDRILYFFLDLESKAQYLLASLSSCLVLISDSVAEWVSAAI